MIGQTLSHFKITAKLGEGGMGEVYRAEDTALDRDVAIKFLPEALTEDPERLARFEREAKVLASLNHPNIAGIHQIEKADGRQLLVMELVEGEDLADRMGRGTMPIEDAVDIAGQVAEGLEAAHERGIVHRDLKPANIKLTPDGQVKILDFGLAKAQEATEASPDLTRSPTLTAQMTQAGVILGTAAYMSPEQARGQEADPRSDLWALGVVLWEMLAGRQLFAEPTVSDTLAAVLRAEIDLKEQQGNKYPMLDRVWSAASRGIPGSATIPRPTCASTSKTRCSVATSRQRMSHSSPHHLWPLDATYRGWPWPWSLPRPSWSVSRSAASACLRQSVPRSLPSHVSTFPCHRTDRLRPAASSTLSPYLPTDAPWSTSASSREPDGCTGDPSTSS